MTWEVFIRRRGRRQESRPEIAAQYLRGEPIADIACALRTSPHAIKCELGRMREAGWDLPHRHRGYGERTESDEEAEQGQ